jgi:hypothetical protein
MKPPLCRSAVGADSSDWRGVGEMAGRGALQALRKTRAPGRMVYLAPSLSRLSNTPNLERHERLCPEETLKKSQASYKWVASDSKSDHHARFYSLQTQSRVTSPAFFALNAHR